MAIWVGARGVHTGPVAAGWRRSNTRRRAAVNSPQVANRSPGARAMARVSTSSTADGRSARRVLIRGGGSDSLANAIARPASRLNGGAPLSSSKAAQASAYWSARPSTAWPSICSGAT